MDHYEFAQRKKYDCWRCGAKGLVWTWDRRAQRRRMVELTAYGPHLHQCPTDDIRATTCRFCGSQDVFWVKRDDKFELTESYGLPHACKEARTIYVAHKEALREDYAFEKRWVNQFPNDSKCKKCDGWGYKSRRGRDGGPPKRGSSTAPCKACKGIGTFTRTFKWYYLFRLRKLYWPWKQGMAWKAWDNP